MNVNKVLEATDYIDVGLQNDQYIKNTNNNDRDNHNVEQKYLNKIESLIEQKNREMEEKLMKQQQEFIKQLNEIKKENINENQQKGRVSAFKQQLLDIKNYTLNKENNNQGTEMTKRSTARDKQNKDSNASSKNELAADSNKNTNDNYNVETDAIPHVSVKDVKLIRNNEIIPTKMAVANIPNNKPSNNSQVLTNEQNEDKYDLHKETLELNNRSNTYPDNFRDESPNLSAIINMDEDDNGSIEIDRKRLSMLSKKDKDKINKQSLALKDIVA